jgi:hypothetical protein
LSPWIILSPRFVESPELLNQRQIRAMILLIELLWMDGQHESATPNHCSPAQALKVRGGSFSTEEDVARHSLSASGRVVPKRGVAPEI